MHIIRNAPNICLVSDNVFHFHPYYFAPTVKSGEKIFFEKKERGKRGNQFTSGTIGQRGIISLYRNIFSRSNFSIRLRAIDDSSGLAFFLAPSVCCSRVNYSRIPRMKGRNRAADKAASTLFVI